MGYKTKILQALNNSNQKLDKDRIILAYEFAKESHIGQYRKSGEEYILHPVEVAIILIRLNMDTDTIVAGLLHDVVEDTLITTSDIKYHFGEVVSNLVDGVTKLKKLPAGTKKQHENIRKMIVAMARDVRVVIIKLADRVHNMRTLKFMKPEKQQSISRETLEIFAPLAHRLGMAKIKWELEDLSFYYLEPVIYKKIVKLVNEKRAEREDYTKFVTTVLKDQLNKYNIKGEVAGRPKHLYSIYTKMYKKNKEFDELYDLIALRIIVDNEGSCYNVLGIIHNIWKPVPGRFKDYIAVPKANGYQSIHTTVVGPEGKFVEVQIRTEKMHRIAEEGIAAHWNYKESNKSQRRDNVYSWLRQILEWQTETDNSQEFIETVTGGILNETVFVFSPQGDVIEMAKGATPLDFAFHIHTQIGYKCIGAKVNGKIVPLDFKLQNGDQVEIITSKSAKGPGKDWLNIVVSHSAKNKIRKWIKEKKFVEKAKDGRQQLEKELQKIGISVKKVETMDETVQFLDKHKLPNFDELLFNFGIGRLRIDTFLEKFKKDEEKEINIAEMLDANNKKSKKSKADKGIIIDGADNTLMRFAKCCTPLPGDDVSGYVTRGQGIAIHRNDCANFINLANNQPARVIEVRWDDSIIEKKVNKYSFGFQILMYDRPQALMDIVRIISDHKINLLAVNSNNYVSKGDKIINIKLTIEINGKQQYSRLISSIEKIKGIIDIKR